ncbi:MAG: ribose-5-phosphate isomerase A [Planctomycetes bacterium]|nr:ribose-5-phosphate isomerase A [Planctomycetota bacterium]
MSTEANSHAAWKRAAACDAVEVVIDGIFVGIGTGSTTTFTIRACADRMRAAFLFLGIPSADRSAALATSLGITLATFADHPWIDLTIDGAHEVERGTLNLVKGHGGSLLREKIVSVFECGLFVGLADVILIGPAAGVTRLERSPQRSASR